MYLLKTESSTEGRASELLEFMWDRVIRPPWWRWWWSSPVRGTCKRVLFGGITALIIFLSFVILFPQFFSFVEEDSPELVEKTIEIEKITQKNLDIEIEKITQAEKVQPKKTTQINMIAYGLVIGLLTLVIFSPNLESIRTKEFDIKLRSPPSFELFLSPLGMEIRIKEFEASYKQ
jgi:hypothetical protein